MRTNGPTPRGMKEGFVARSGSGRVSPDLRKRERERSAASLNFKIEDGARQRERAKVINEPFQEGE